MKKVGVIGCGGISGVHGWVLSEMEDVQITAVCDIEPERAEDFAQKYVTARKSKRPGAENANCIVVTDWRRLCDMELDVVHICTPHALHAPMATALLKSGKAVFMEKPCAVSREQFEELRKAVGLHPGKLGFCFQNRYNKTTETVDRLIKEGRIGAVTGARAFVTWRRDEEYYLSSPWKGRLATEGGGALINQAIHTLDLLLRYLGRPELVEASVHNHHLPGIIEVEDTVEAWMVFPGGRRACFYASNGYATDAPVILEIQGDRGRIMLCDQEVTLQAAGGETEHFQCISANGMGKSYWGAGHKACIRDFYESLESGKAFPADLAGVETTFDTMMQIYEKAAVADSNRR